MRMLLAPIRSGPSAELSWLVAETDALRNFRREVPSAEAARMTEETKRWVMRDYRNPHALGDEHTGQLLTSLLKDFGVARIENWSNQDWQAFTLHFMWRLCQRGARVAGAPEAASTNYRRPRDLAVLSGAGDPDLLTHDVLTLYTSLSSIRVLPVGHCLIAMQAFMLRFSNCSPLRPRSAAVG